MQESIVRIDALTAGPSGIGRLGSGKAVFVEGTAPGDTVRVAVHEEKAKYARARVLEVLEGGSVRVQPHCPLAAECGGCSWQHVSYDAQLEAKRANVVAQLVHIAHFTEENAEALVGSTMPSKKTLGYRNKLELAAGRDNAGKLVLGMHKADGGGLIPLASCPLAKPGAAKAPKALQGALRYLEGTSDLGIFRVGIRTSPRTKSTEIALWTTPGAFPRHAAAKTLASAVNASSIVRVIAQPGKSRAVKSVEVLSGAGHWEEDLGDFRYKVSAPSFFQVNTAQAESLVSTVVDGLGVNESSRVADLYCGVGTFTLPLAELAGEVLAVESSGPAVRDLRRNVDEAGVWAECLGGDSARELPQMGHLDALVVDPPRAGLAPGVAESIAQAGPERLAYVSCDGATWARDVARLEACGYRLERATPVDLFPQTYHVETVSLFRL